MEGDKKMNKIISVEVIDNKFHLNIDGDNIDILEAVGLIIKTMKEQSGLSYENALEFLEGYLECDE